MQQQQQQHSGAKDARVTSIDVKVVTVRPRTLMSGLTNRRTHSMKVPKEEVIDVNKLQEQLAVLHGEKQILENRLKCSLKENKRLVDKVAELLSEKQDLEETIRRKNDLLKFKPRGKLASFMTSMQDKLKNRPSLETVKQKKIWRDEACFDTDLDKVLMHEQLTLVPKVLVECIAKLESQPAHMQLVGLYRASGNHATIQKLRFKIDANNYRALHDQTDGHNIAGIVKLFFRELKEPLISLKYIETALGDREQFMAKTEREQIADICRLYTLLPTINRSTLKYFIEHVSRVDRMPQNEMTARSLSMVCGACICYETVKSSSGGGRESFAVPNRCVELMIVHNREVFK